MPNDTEIGALPPDPNDPNATPTDPNATPASFDPNAGGGSSVDPNATPASPDQAAVPTSVVFPTDPYAITGSLSGGPPATSFEAMPQDPSAKKLAPPPGPIYGSPPSPPKPDPNSSTAGQYAKDSIAAARKAEGGQDIITKAQQDLAFKQGNIFTDAANDTKKHIDDLAIMSANLDNIIGVNNGNSKKELDRINATKEDPNHYWNSKSTGGKIAAGIGIILGGLGQGLAMWGPHGNKQATNVALDQIDKAIHDDIDAQKANKDDMWKQYQAHRGIADNEENRKRWEIMHSEQSYLDGQNVFLDKLKAATAQSQDPIAKGNGEIAIAAWDQKIADEKRAFGQYGESQAAGLRNAIEAQRLRDWTDQKEKEKITLKAGAEAAGSTAHDVAVAAVKAPDELLKTRLEVLQKDADKADQEVERTQNKFLPDGIFDPAHSAAVVNAGKAHQAIIDESRAHASKTGIYAPPGDASRPIPFTPDKK